MENKIHGKYLQRGQFRNQGRTNNNGKNDNEKEINQAALKWTNDANSTKQAFKEYEC